MHGAEEIREFLLRPIEHILRKQPSSRTEFLQRNRLRRSQRAPQLVKLPRQQSSEDRMHIAGSVEVARLAELRCIASVITEFGMIETQLHVAREGNRSTLADFLLDDPPEFAHSPFFWRSARSCGVRMNISTK